MLYAVRRRRRSRLSALVASGVVLLTPLLAGAQEADLDEEHRRVQDRRAVLAADIDATRASDEEVSSALTAVIGDVESQRFRVEDTERGAAQAAATLAAAREQVAAARAAVERAGAQLREAAVDGYVRPPAAAQMDRLFTSEPGRGEVRDALARSAVRSTADALDRMRAAQEDLTRAESAADAAELQALGSHAEAEIRLAELEVAHARQANLVADVENRLDHLLGEAAALSSRNAELAAQITQREAALAAQVAAAAQAAAAAEAAAAARANTPSPRPTSIAPAAVSAARSAGSVSVANVGGIEVNAEIADQLGAMLAAAAADGITLSGGGWRSSDEQIAIRMSVCGTSEYAIWEMPSWECSPPVARPGRSMHEQGLAIDFTSSSGDLVRSRSDPVFAWLTANAERFGFYNLPSEPWHWSTTGS